MNGLDFGGKQITPEKRRNDGRSFSFCTSFPLWLVNNTEMAIIHEVHLGFPCIMPLNPGSCPGYRCQFIDKESEVQEGSVVCPRELVLWEVMQMLMHDL